MRKIILYIALSLDGYIADEEGGVDWLQGTGSEEEVAVSYQTFEKTVDTVIMGWKTYHQVANELSPDMWMYEHLKTYVITHRDAISTDGIKFTIQDPCSLVKELRELPGGDIWICGGPSIIRPLIRENLIDRYVLSFIPVLLGKGIPLFEAGVGQIDLEILSHKNYGGIMELVYERRK